MIYDGWATIGIDAGMFGASTCYLLFFTRRRTRLACKVWRRPLRSLVNFGFMAYNPFLYSGIYLQYANIILHSLVKGTGTANTTFQKGLLKADIIKHCSLEVHSYIKPI